MCLSLIPINSHVHMYSGLQKLSIVGRTDNEMLNKITIQMLNNLSLILIGLNRNAEALSLLNEATERNLCMFICEFVCINILCIMQDHNSIHSYVPTF